MPVFQSDVVNSFEIDLAFSKLFNNLIIRACVFKYKMFLSIFRYFLVDLRFGNRNRLTDICLCIMSVGSSDFDKQNTKIKHSKTN